MRLLRNIALVAAAMGPLMLVTVVAEATQFKIATIAPAGSQWMLDLQAGSKKIKDHTEGRATFKV